MRPSPEQMNSIQKLGSDLCSYGLYSDGLFSYGLDGYDLHSYNLYSYGLYSYGLLPVTQALGPAFEHAQGL